MRRRLALLPVLALLLIFTAGTVNARTGSATVAKSKSRTKSLTKNTSRSTSLGAVGTATASPSTGAAPSAPGQSGSPTPSRTPSRASPSLSATNSPVTIVYVPEAQAASGPSAGTIAGVVIGSLVGVAVLVAAALFLYRKSQPRARAVWFPGGSAARPLPVGKLPHNQNLQSAGAVLGAASQIQEGKQLHSTPGSQVSVEVSPQPMVTARARSSTRSGSVSASRSRSMRRSTTAAPSSDSNGQRNARRRPVHRIRRRPVSEQISETASMTGTGTDGAVTEAELKRRVRLLRQQRVRRSVTVGPRRAKEAEDSIGDSTLHQFEDALHNKESQKTKVQKLLVAFEQFHQRRIAMEQQQMPAGAYRYQALHHEPLLTPPPPWLPLPVHTQPDGHGMHAMQAHNGMQMQHLMQPQLEWRPPSPYHHVFPEAESKQGHVMRPLPPAPPLPREEHAYIHPEGWQGQDIPVPGEDGDMVAVPRHVLVALMSQSQQQMQQMPLPHPADFMRPPSPRAPSPRAMSLTMGRPLSPRLATVATGRTGGQSK